jgi:quercetin dioxygenase-like cupin family protein
MFGPGRPKPALEKKEKEVITLFGTGTPAKDNSRRRKLLSIGGVASAGVLALGLVASFAVRAQPSGLQIIPLAQGLAGENNTVNLHVDGPSDVLQTELLFQPGGETGWHIHPGPVVVVVKSGALTETHSDGCVTVHPAGSVFFETKDEVHNAANQTSVVADVYATFLSPAGAQPLIPVANPGGVCRGNH